MTSGLRAIGVALAAALACAGAAASQQLALDKGCINCHGEPPKKSAPSFAQLALRYAPARGDSARLHALADKLREGSIFGHVGAHERLDHETAEQLVAWIAQGAR